jgi:hypothetical protein
MISMLVWAALTPLALALVLDGLRAVARPGISLLGSAQHASAPEYAHDGGEPASGRS